MGNIFDNLKLIVLNGPPRSGKDTLGGLLRKAIMNDDRSPYIAEEVKLAAPIKRVAKALFNLTNDEMESWDGPLKDSRAERFLGNSFRDIQISVSEDWIKPQFGHTAFVDLLKEELEDYLRMYSPQPIIAIVTDGGFNVEVRELQKLVPSANRMVVQMHRSGCDFNNDSREYVSFSDQVPYRVDNEGSLEELEGKAQSLIKLLLQQA